MKIKKTVADINKQRTGKRNNILHSNSNDVRYIDSKKVTAEEKPAAMVYIPNALVRSPAANQCVMIFPPGAQAIDWRSEEHTSELQSRENLVCRLLLEKKK